MKTKTFTLTLACSFFLSLANTNAATFTYNNATAWQNWNVPGNWAVVGIDADGIPDADDNVTIPTGFQVTANLTSAMNSLTINGDIRFRNPVTPTLTIGTLNMNNGTLGHNTGNRVGVIAVTGDMKLLTGSCTIGEVSLTVAGTLRVYSTYNESSTQGTITFNEVQMYFGSNWVYNNTETFNVTNNFTMKGATVDGSANGRFIIGGNLIIDSLNNNWGRSRLTENGTIIINNGATFTITDLPGAKLVNNITVNTGGTWNDVIGESWSIAGNIINNATINMTAGTWTLTGTNKTISGTQQLSIFNTTISGSYTNNGSYLAVNTLGGSGSLTQGIGSTLDIDRTITLNTLNASAANNTVLYSRDAAQTVKLPDDGAYYNLTISGVSGVKTLANATVVLNNLVIGTGVSLDVTNAHDYQLNVGGNWTNDGTFTERNGLVVFDGSGSQVISNFSTETFFDLQFSNTGTKTLDATIIVTDDIDILNPATLDASVNNYSITVGDDWTNTGVFIPQQGTVTFSNAGTGSINGAGTNNFYNLISDSPANTLNTTATLAGTLSIPSGNFNTTGQSFTLISNATNTGRIAAISAPRFTGNITMQRHIPGTTTGWGLLGSCITTTIASWTDDFPTSGFTGSTGYAGGFKSIYSYNEAAPGVFDNAAAYVAVTNATNAVAIGTGRWVYLGTGAVTTSDITVDVTGAPKIGNHSFPVTFTASGGAAHDGWNLIANPYPSPIDWNAAAGWTKSNVSGTIYIWNADFNQYATWNGVTGTNGGTRFIASSQGFYVQANAASPVLSCTESVKTLTNATMLRESQNNGEGDIIRFIVKGNEQYDETLFGFQQDATNDFDQQYDAVKMKSPIPTAPSLTQVVNNKEFAMNFVSAANRNATIELRFLTVTNGDYNLSVEGIDLFPANECVILKDLVTGSVVDLKVVKSYDFYAFSNQDDIRFIIQISSPLPINTMDVSCGNTNDGAIEIEQLVQGWSYQVINNNGFEVASGYNPDKNKIEKLNAGTYHVKFNNGNACNVLEQVTEIKSAPAVKAFAEIASVEVNANTMKVIFDNQSENGISTWDFGDGVVISSKSNEIEHIYQNVGTYNVKLTVNSGVCREVLNISVRPDNEPEVNIQNANNDSVKLSQLNDVYQLKFNLDTGHDVNIDVMNSYGQLISRKKVIASTNTQNLDFGGLAQGVYLVRVYGQKGDIFCTKLIK